MAGTPPPRRLPSPALQPAHFLLVTLGSHGDVHPFVGLGRRLIQRGHRVTLATNEHFRPLAESTGLDFEPVGEEADFLALAKHPDLWHPTRGALVVAGAVASAMGPVYDAVVRRLDARTVVVGSTLALAARVARDELHFPMATVHLAPIVFRSIHAPPRMPGVPAIAGRLPSFMLTRFYEGADKYVIDPALAPAVNAFRAERGLPPVERIMQAWWNAPDLTIGLWPAWFAPPQPDWPAQARLTGFPLYDESDVSPLPEELERFLDAGDAPAAFTPGSAMQHGQQFFAAAVAACERLGRRGLLLTRHDGQVPDVLPPTVLHVRYAPFSRLLPRCCAISHHGGIGTTSQALAAGVPQLVMPMAHDQFDNAARARKLGVATTLSPRRYRPRAVAGKLARLLGSARVADRCKATAARLVGSGAVDETCGLLESLSPS